MTIQSKFPALDADRTDADREYDRHIIDAYPPAEPHIPEVDAWVALPLRLAYSQASGYYLEVGPYDLNSDDIERLRAAIAGYDLATRPGFGGAP